MPAVMVELSAGQKQILERAGIFLAPFVQADREMHIVSETDVTRALALLGCALEQVRGSGLEGIDFAVLAPSQGAAQAAPSPRRRGGAPEVRLTGPNVDRDRRALDPLSRAVQECFAIGRSVVIHPVGGKKSPPLQDGRFHIPLFASPSGERRYTPPDAMWGIRVTS